MFRILCKSKIHRATLTGANLHYEGSIAIDQALIEAADILPNEIVQVVNINNGNRFETYVIKAPRRSGTITLNGAAARLGLPGDKVIVISSCYKEDAEAKKHQPKIVCVDNRNRIAKKTKL
ncbi:MAG: aspartate 1-decarboxylase [Candidatus Edwardsbacteria bacterium]|nr:aspartate 1-decarboxylase [Candidatus Edwardsbacteria bacterium]MBU1576253.1 aspartate 1-decarboxylase [Candidatus Edwardsbacteria bacterium]MBU2462652.1 aspartate 1-decarboxylase [Candidatus Edwardsbacteria bacterium]MBU2594435.1 aspartate 1-decarboxylase [Candidatus Edwardsbacteria bacterium]